MQLNEDKSVARRRSEEVDDEEAPESKKKRPEPVSITFETQPSVPFASSLWNQPPSSDNNILMGGNPEVWGALAVDNVDIDALRGVQAEPDEMDNDL